MSGEGAQARRRVLFRLAALSVSALAPRAFADPQPDRGSGEWPSLAGPREDRRLSFVHTHTGERLEVDYAGNGDGCPQALAQVNRFLRDHRTGEEHAIDPRLLEVLHDLRLAIGARSPFAVISGYRSPHTNAILRARSGGVAGGSLHMQGMAIDVRLSGVRTAALRDAALELGRGGVGYYADSDFVHLDTGRVRRW
jgi:uncharacterized protein YcbK (DUF882 family)